MKPFDKLVNALYNLYAAVIPRLLPVPEKNQSFWSAPRRLDWLALGREQESFYLNFACGEYQGKYGSTRGALRPLKEFITTKEVWNEKSRIYEIRIDTFMGEPAPADTLTGDDILHMARYQILDWDGPEFEDEDESDVAEDQEELAGFLVQCALAIVLIRLERELIPELSVELPETLELTLFDDIEASDMNLTDLNYSGIVVDQENLLKRLPELCSNSSQLNFLKVVLTEGLQRGEDIVDFTRTHYPS